MTFKLERREADISLGMVYRDCIAILRRHYDFVTIVMTNIFLGMSLIYAVHHINLRTDALQNVTRIRSQESSNATTPYEDISNCTILSLKHCEQFYTGQWYIETNNSVNGELKKYSYYMDDGQITSCKETKDGDFTKKAGNFSGKEGIFSEIFNRKDLSCSYYVGVYISFACLLSAAVIVLFEGKDVERILHCNLVAASFSSTYFIITLAVIGLVILHNFEDFAGNPLETAALGYTFPAVIHFYLFAVVGWLSIFSQRHHFVIGKKTDVSTPELTYSEAIFRWIPFCVYISAFFVVNWLLSYAGFLFPDSLIPPCEESCWLFQESLLMSFGAPVVTFMVFSVIGSILKTYCGSQLPDLLLRERHSRVITEVLAVMSFIWMIGITPVVYTFLAPLRTVFNVISLFEGVGVLAVGIYFENGRLKDSSDIPRHF